MTAGFIEYLKVLAVDAPDYPDLSQVLEANPYIADPVTAGRIKLAMDFFRAWASENPLLQQPFGPMIAFGDKRYPLPLEEVDQETLETWRDIGLKTEDPLVRSRLCHLTWTIGGTGAHVFAREAVLAYLVLLDRKQRVAVYRVQDFGYALDIALRLRDESLITQCIEKGSAWIESLLDDPDAGPGAVIGGLTFLAGLSPSSRPENLGDMCLRARALFLDPYNQEAILEVEILISPQSERSRIGTEIVRVWMAAAEAAEGLIRAAHLQSALAQAQFYGLTAEQEKVMAALGSVDISRDLKLISVTVDIPSEEYEKMIKSYVIHEEWGDALSVIGIYNPSPQSFEEVVAEAQKLIAEFPLQNLASTTLVGSDGRPSQFVLDEQSKLSLRIATTERIKIGISGDFLVRVLGAFFAKWKPSMEELQAFFGSAKMPKSVVHGFALGITHYMNGDWESATLVILPRIEESLRRLATLHGIQTLKASGNYVDKRGIRDLVTDLKETDHEPVFRYLDSLLVNRMAINLRNNALHGISPTATQKEAALVVHAALILIAQPLGP
jgi:hypothetical protein